MRRGVNVLRQTRQIRSRRASRRPTLPPVESFPVVEVHGIIGRQVMK